MYAVFIWTFSENGNLVLTTKFKDMRSEKIYVATKAEVIEVQAESGILAASGASSSTGSTTEKMGSSTGIWDNHINH